jgi:hypothetical protein
MQDLPANDNEELADEIFGAETYKAPEPQKKDFSPWHKPRKQFVRHHQWCKQIEALLEEMRPDGNTLKYLGLPGDDLLDLRYFHTQVCEPRKMGFRFLGFNHSADPKNSMQTDLNISLDEVRRLSRVDHLSEIIWDDFRLVADESSKAWDKTKALGPYDIINLDLCDGFGAQKPGTLDTHYNAVSRLMSLQAKNKFPWLLFLTTRTGKQDIHADLLQKFIEMYERNLADCAPFKQTSTDELAIGDADALRVAITTPDGHLPIFLMGICKWILGLALGQQPQSKVEVKSIIGYRIDVSAAHDDLISLALRFEPTFAPTEDPLGLANLPAALLSECTLAAKVLKRLGKRRCADKILADNAVLMSEMVTATETLLALARYDVEAYQTWLQTA